MDAMPSLRERCSRCVSAVRTLMPSLRATSLLARPSTRRTSTSRSRAVSADLRLLGGRLHARSQDGVDHVGGEGKPALVNALDGLDELGRGRVLHHVAVHAAARHADHVLLAGVDAEGDDLGARNRQPQPARELAAVQRRQVDVQDDDVGRRLLELAQSLRVVGRLAHHRDRALLSQIRADSRAHHGMIVHQEYLDLAPGLLFHAASPGADGSGARTLSVVPVPRAERTSRTPPTDSARSRMLPRPMPRPSVV